MLSLHYIIRNKIKIKQQINNEKNWNKFLIVYNSNNGRSHSLFVVPTQQQWQILQNKFKYTILSPRSSQVSSSLGKLSYGNVKERESESKREEQTKMHKIYLSMEVTFSPETINVDN